MVEVGGEDNPDVALNCQSHDGAMSLGGLFTPFLALLFVGFKVATQQLLPLCWCSGQLVKQVRVFWFLPVFLLIPGFRRGVRIVAMNVGKLSDQIECYLPTGRNSRRP